MLVKKQKVNLLTLTKREGVSKSTKEPYMFYQATFLDEDAKVITMNLNRKLSENVALMTKTASLRNVAAEIDFSLNQSGFKLTGTVADLRV